MSTCCLETQERKCNICKLFFPLTSFYRSKYLKHGRTYRCKSCDNKLVEIKHKSNPKYPAIHTRSVLKSIKKYPEKQKARILVRQALEQGVLSKTKCYCGEIKVEGHHQDYSKPLEVVWLCAKHHKEKHRI